MKHKLWLIMLTFVSTLCLAFGLSACGFFGLTEPEGPGGEQPPLSDFPQNGYSDNGLYFELNEDGISYAVFKGNFNGTSLNIPATFDGAPVTVIGSEAFNGCSRLTSITIPNGVTSIGDRAFYVCSELTSIEIPDSVTSIGDTAFYWCSGLKSVIWNAENCTKVGAYSNGENNTIFQRCTNLSTVTFGENVKRIPAYAFYNCSRLTGELKIPDSVTWIGVHAFENCNGLTIVTIGSGVTSIGSYAFEDCSELRELKIPDSVTSIGEGAFYGCSWLTSIEIPDSVTSIEQNTFEDCSELESVTIGSGVTSIGDEAFSGCSRLTSITIPNGVAWIGDSAFFGCSGLESVIWNAENCTYAGSNKLVTNGTIFQLCKNLSTVTFGENVKTIPAYAFYECRLGGELKIPDGVTSIGDHAFCGSYGLTSITIPDSVTSIGEGAFEGCWGLTSITIPDSVTEIEYRAFWGCHRFESVTIGSGVTRIGAGAFYGCSYLKAVYYKGTAEEWKNISINNTDSYSSSILNVTRYYFTEDAPAAEEWESYDYWWHYDPATNEPTPWVKDQ